MRFVSLIIMLFSQVSYSDVITKVEVFTNHMGAVEQLARLNSAVVPFEVVIYDLDAVDQWEDEFSKNLSGDEAIARSQIDAKIKKMGENEFNEQVLNAYQPLQRSIQLNLMEYPAVVVNEEKVIYGTDSVDLAIKRFKKWVHSKRK